MRTDVRIDHLVLDGVELSHRQRDALGPAIARELRRLADRPVVGPADQGAADRGRDSTVIEIARQVAGSVHRAVSAVRPPAAVTRSDIRRGRR
ncbi:MULTISPECIES: hypothetical protein [Mycobacterium]|uniref:Uncharacterized protein n=1 Tax=Mycobacterium kiyosense TaxID=2871094 RepID=A0A9P3Q9A7_9MYCO|nr:MULTISPECIES: hypothetical protein [Mycobacterium]BDB45522.1 hypothetical protein IWGMT90018_59680 [Mycobacterium kiyosense]BDE11151.1 hypothetical protein MKCMC460_00110 [Mycobacterium sp. 20KCMC460]GLB83529.1 hypothetical protein SRL2020028_27850 [Mycobacterium kiyosense]GLB91402.1 hypothetical protein SRL2020130_42190 [Mycobacterium kiyosense]GLB97552.1 hypothetical protein SRL2020226_43280 [Mycobacterium kiyosense]